MGKNTEQRQRHCWPASGTSPRAVAPHTAAEGSGPATGAQTPTSSAMAQAAKHLRKNKDLEIQLEQERKEKEEERNKKRSRSRDKKRKVLGQFTVSFLAVGLYAADVF
ncbi:hypothetical protein F7725_012575 [Dissostichus mawsoni]|uniref:Uncharacterized protein n=1 Tax=Dissostichus mawsoni TaxID=36200 RepID=A0A7J5YNU3_DISMA|nr:hypothetical protein F7725_012575 [Dissostichus mawsoni]